MSDKKNFPLCVMLTAKDMKKSVAFYRDTLGFEMKEAWPDRDKPIWASFQLDGQVVMLGAPAGDCGGCEPEGDAHKAESALYLKTAADLKTHPAGLGMSIYLLVKDVDSYYETIAAKGAGAKTKPVNQFYGQRDFIVDDPDGYRLVFYTPVAMASCQSCGMPLAGAKPGQMYCQYCTDDKGQLKPYEVIFEGTTTNYFMDMQKMPREAAEKAAREHLAKMPTWAARK